MNVGPGDLGINKLSLRDNMEWTSAKNGTCEDEWCKGMYCREGGVDTKGINATEMKAKLNSFPDFCQQRTSPRRI